MPTSAVVVSPTGNDAATGSVAYPLRTLGAAVARVKTGGTIVLRAGSYHESVSVPSNKSVTIQAYPQEIVWLDGSSAVADWRQSGSTWVHDNWTPQFDSGAASSGGYVGSAYPMAGHPDQMWLDGRPLTQVGSASAVTTTSFFVDYAAKTLVIGVDPTGHLLRASDLSIALTVSAPASVVRGIGVRSFANSIGDIAALRMTGTDARLENVVVSGNATTGVAVTRTGAIVRHVTAEDNGLLGMVANYADGILVDSLLAQGNNVEHFNRAPVSGGVKITRTRGLQVRDSVLRANDGPGLWLDESCYRAVVVGNRMTDNVGHGMSFEISDTAIIANNTITGNGGDGVKLNDSGNIQLWNNVIGGGKSGVDMVQDFRRNANLSDPGHDPRQAQPDASMPWIVQNIVVANNILDPTAAGRYQVVALDASAERTAAQMALMVDGNMFTKPTGAYEFLWSLTPGKGTAYLHTTQYTAATADGTHNHECDGRYAPSTVVPTDSLPLPPEIAAAIGVTAGSRHLGTY